jgi:hypothetical protein
MRPFRQRGPHWDYAAELVLLAATTGEEWWRTIRLHRGFLPKSLQRCLWVLIQPRQNLIVENGTFISDIY